MSITSNICIYTKQIQDVPPPRGACPLGERKNHVYILYLLDVILMNIFNVILMHIFDVRMRMHILNVLLLLLATTVIALLLWELHRCDSGD